MPKQTSNLSINFLSHTNIEATKLGKTIAWALTAGKAIVFLVFLMVMAAFLYRFYLDKKIETLQEVMDENVSRIQEYSDSEPKMRALQAKLDTIDTLTETQQNTSIVLKKVETSLPVGTVLDNIEIAQNGTVTFKGTTPNEVIFAGLLEALKSQPEFNGIIVDELRSGGVQNPQITFSLRFKYSVDTSKEELPKTQKTS